MALNRAFLRQTFNAHRKAWIGALALAAIIVLALLFYVPGSPRTTAPSATSTEAAALSVTVEHPRSANLPELIHANGAINAWQEAIISSETAGQRLTEVAVNVGDVVKKGDLLARFDARTLAAEAAQARANAAQAHATLENARTETTRANELKARNFISQAQLDQNIRQERVAAAQYQAARAALAAAQVRLTQTQLRAPDAGIISARSATLGAVSSAGQELFRLIRQGRLEWRAEITAAEAARLRPGMSAEIRSESWQGILPGRLRVLAPSADPNTRNLIAYIDLPEHVAEGGLAAGTFAQGDISLGTRPGLTLPQQAVVARDGFSFVFTIDADNRAHQVKVTPGIRLGDRVEIRNGLMPDMRVAVQGAGFLNDGDHVRIVPPLPSATP